MTTTAATTQAPECRTFVVDLRTEYAALTACDSLNAFVWQRAAGSTDPEGAARYVDLSRVVVIDRAADLFAHSDAMAVVLNAAAVRHVVCVAVGMADSEAGVPVRLPNILRNEATTVLWVGDEHGIRWNPGDGPASTVSLDPAHAGDTHLADLIEALTAMEVFGEVVKRVAGMPSRVAVPGVRIVSNRVGSDVLVAAQRRAVDAIVDGADRVIPEQPADRDPAALGNELAHKFGHPDRTQPGGRFGQTRGDAERAVQALGAVVATAGRPWRLLTPQHGQGIPGLLNRSAEALKTYRETLRRILVIGDPGTDDQRRARLRAEEIMLPATPGGAAAEQPAAVDEVRRAILAGIEAGRPLRRLVTEIFETASALRPAGSAVRAPTVDHACPDQQLAQLTGASPMPGGFGSPVVPLLMLLAPVFAVAPAIWSPLGQYTPIGLGLAVVLLLVLGATLLRRRRNRLGLARPVVVRDIAMVLVVLLIAAAAPAGLIALLLTGQIGGSDLPPIPVGFVWSSAGFGMLLALAAIGLWWNRLVGAWRLRLPVDQPARLWRSLTAVYDEAAAEWVLTDARIRASDAVRTLGSTLDSLADELVAHGAALDAGPSGGTSASAVATIGTVNAIVRHDLVGLATTCIDQGAADIRRGERDGVPDRVARRVRHLAGVYDRHVRYVGIQSPPPGWPVRQSREQLVLIWWRGLEAFRRAVVADGPVQQLCSDDQVQLLGRNPASASTVVFAPRSARAAIIDPGDSAEGNLDPRLAGGRGEPVWTAAGTSAGMLHLVPLRVRVEFEQLEATA